MTSDAERLATEAVDAIRGMSNPTDRVVEVAKRIREASRLAYESAAKVCYDADKSTHPTDLGDRIRALAKQETNHEANP